MQNLRSSREIKPKKLEDKLFILNSKGSTYNSRNQSNNKNINNNINKKQRHNSASRGRCHKIIKENNRENKEKLIKDLQKKLNNHLKKYNLSENEYNKKIINDIIYDEKKHIVSVLKDYIIEDGGNDFLKRFYYKHESINRLPKITGYYEKYTLFSPIYFHMEDIVKIMLKNVKKKKKYLEMIEENEDLELNENNENLEFTHLINPSDISDNTLTFTINSFLNPQNDNNSNNLSYLVHNFVNDEKLILFEKDNIFNIDNRIRNNSYEIVLNDLEISKSIFNTNIEEKIQKISSKNVKDNEIITQKIINYKNISNKAKIPKKGKILEIKKLDLRNINNLESINKKKDEQKQVKTKENNSDRQKKSNYYSNNYLKTTKTGKNKISKVIKEKTNRMIIPQNLNNHLSTTRANTSKHVICINNKLNFNENIAKIVKYPKKTQLSNRTNSNRFKTVIQKKNVPIAIQISNKKINLNDSNLENSNSKNKNESGNTSKCHNKQNYKKKKYENFNNQIMTSPNTFNGKKSNLNKNMVSSIYNINLNLNLAKVNRKDNSSKPTSIKKKVNTCSNQNKKNNIGKNINNNLNNIKGNTLTPSSQNSNLQHKVSKIQFNLNNQKKNLTNKIEKDNKVCNELNSNNKTNKNTINKQMSFNNNTSTTNTNTNPPSITIIINSHNEKKTNNLEDNKKKDSKNNNKKSKINNKNYTKNKRNVISLRENKSSSKNEKKTKQKIKETPKDSFELINTIYKETSMSFGKLRKQLKIELLKKYPLTSRNEKECIPFDLINKMLKKKEKI